jgi:5,10-methylenetetrahydromethanopterin reductase
MTGVIGHIVNPTIAEATDLAVEAERCGAEWIGFADAFWWRDVWMILSSVAAETSTIRIGPAMTNPYLRHSFHTASALATLGELAGPRTLLGVAAGGSEVTHAAHLSRGDAPRRVSELVKLVLDVANGSPLDPASGRGLDISLSRPRVLISGRGDKMLETAGAHGDDILLWAIPDSDLERSIDVIKRGARHRSSQPRLIWAPLVRHDARHESSLLHVAVYASLNTSPQIRAEWGLDETLVSAIRSALVSGGTTAAIELVPDAALEDLLVERDIATLAARANSLGISAIATPGFATDTLQDQLMWAAEVEAQLEVVLS